METALTEMIKQAPSAGAVIFVVIYFLRYLKQLIESWEKKETEREQRREAAEEVRLKVIEENTRVLGAVLEHLRTGD